MIDTELDKYIRLYPPREEEGKVIANLYSNLDDEDRFVISELTMRASRQMGSVGPLSALELIFKLGLYMAAKDHAEYKDKIAWKIRSRAMVQNYYEREINGHSNTNNNVRVAGSGDPAASDMLGDNL